MSRDSKFEETREARRRDFTPGDERRIEQIAVLRRVIRRLCINVVTRSDSADGAGGEGTRERNRRREEGGVLPFSFLQRVFLLTYAGRCRGTVALVHVECLERWLTESGRARCELCGYRYATRMVPRHGLFRSVAIWFHAVIATRQVRRIADAPFPRRLLRSVASVIYAERQFINVKTAHRAVSNIFENDGIMKLRSVSSCVRFVFERVRFEIRSDGVIPSLFV